MTQHPDSEPGRLGKAAVIAVLVAPVALTLALVMLGPQPLLHLPFLLDDLTAVEMLHPEGPFEPGRLRHGLWPSDERHAYHAHFRPVGWASIGADFALFGPRPAPLRVVAILIHGLIAVLLACLIRRWLGDPWFGPAELIPAAWFFMHAAAVEPVVWLAHRFTLLAGLFWVLLVMALIRHAATGRTRAGVVAAALLALCSKDSQLTEALAALVVVPCFAASGDRWKRSRSAVLLVGAAWIVVLLLRTLATGHLLPTFEEGGDVAAGFDPVARLRALPGVFAALFAPGWPGFVLAAAAIALAFVRMRGAAVRAAILLFAVMGAGLPVLEVADDFDGSRRLYLPTMAAAILMAGGLRGRGAWIGLGLLLLMGPVLNERQAAYKEAGRMVEQVVADVERAASADERVPIHVTGLPATQRGAPAFGPRLQHLGVRFRPPLRDARLEVRGFEAWRLGAMIDDAQRERVILSYAAPGTHGKLAPPEVWRIGGAPSPHVLDVSRPVRRSRWNGVGLRFGVAARDAPTRVLVSLGEDAHVVARAARISGDAGRWQVEVALDGPLLAASPGVAKLLRRLATGPLETTLRVQVVAPVDSDAVGARSPAVPVTLTRDP